MYDVLNDWLCKGLLKNKTEVRLDVNQLLFVYLNSVGLLEVVVSKKQLQTSKSSSKLKNTQNKGFIKPIFQLFSLLFSLPIPFDLFFHQTFVAPFILLITSLSIFAPPSLFFSSACSFSPSCQSSCTSCTSAREPPHPPLQTHTLTQQKQPALWPRWPGHRTNKPVSAHRPRMCNSASQGPVNTSARVAFARNEMRHTLNPHAAAFWLEHSQA